MEDKELFDGFHIAQVKLEKGKPYNDALKIVSQSVRNPTLSAEDVKKRGQAYYDQIVNTAHALFNELVSCMAKGEKPSSDAVQKIIQKHHAFTNKIHDATKEVYLAFAKLYAEHPAFRKQLDPFHSELGKFMGEAMAIFAAKQLA